MCAAFVACNKTAAHLNSFSAQSECSCHLFARSYTASSNKRSFDGVADLWDQHHCSSLFTTVMSSCFKTFGNDRIHARLFTFKSELNGTHHVYHRNSMLFKVRCPRFRISRTRKNN